MLQFFYRANNKKGFTLIELIVVIAILGILAAIAIPRFSGIQKEAAIQADAATSEQIINTARIFEAQNNLAAGTADLTDVGTLMTVPAASKSGAKGAFTLGYTSPNYIVSWGTGASYTEANVLTKPTD